jgi:DNA-binding winged helix-turn-helix (wHTH) protein
MTYRFEDFELDTDRFELRKQGVQRPIEPQVFALLRLLVENCHRMVPRDEIVETVWAGRVVSEAALSSRIKSARQSLEDDGARQRLIRTVHGQGFRFVGTVIPAGGPEAIAAEPATAEARSRDAGAPDHRGPALQSEAMRLRMPISSTASLRMILDSPQRWFPIRRAILVVSPTTPRCRRRLRGGPGRPPALTGR